MLRCVLIPSQDRVVGSIPSHGMVKLAIFFTEQPLAMSPLWNMSANKIKRKCQFNVILIIFFKSRLKVLTTTSGRARTVGSALTSVGAATDTPTAQISRTRTRDSVQTVRTSWRR